MSIDTDVRPAQAGTVPRPYPVSEWAQWHADRESALREEHGWLSLTGFHWLPPEAGALEGVPGRWSADGTGAHAEFSAADGVLLEDSGAVVDGAVAGTVPEQGSLRWVRFGDRQVELILRGGRYAIRIRDPHAPALQAFSGVPTFPLDPQWVLPARVVPRAAREIVPVGTSRADLRQDARLDADVLVDLPDGTQVSLAATAGADGNLSIEFHDATNGVDTARWRILFTGAPGPDGAVDLDFNRALIMPFAFSDFGTCPAPVPGNVIPVAVTAGELAPTRALR